MTATLHQYRKLHRLLLEERECAMNLDLAGLQRTVEEKSALLGALPPTREDELTPELRELAGKIQKENRRNAYLFWSSLNWVRETMNFYSRQIANPAYGESGRQISNVNGGSLLSGKV
ncbi:flagellar protein FlgN [Geothermobacter hydrogeniphilus]|uniref:Flagellar protein FlgN n=1 Tax=Geothermobacter hydrogeniphilus TaxID=1969733 RepID=A0A2K2HCX5_9BACT|nr:flagellar protein FlgN [Geothermobacter hydrogeniphilus]PNU21147.1 flagellar protein FlgN [Geothermobacter hydrogeniphilus]